MCPWITRGSKVGNDPSIESRAGSTQNNQEREDFNNMGFRVGNNPSFELQESCMPNTTGTVEDFSDIIKYDILLVKHSNHQVNQIGVWIIVGVTNSDSFEKAYSIIDKAIPNMEGIQIRASSDNLVQMEKNTENETHIRKRLLQKQKYKWLENTKTGCHLILMIDGPTHETEQQGSSEVQFPAANNDFTRNLKLDNAELVPLEKAMKSLICDQYSGNWEGNKKSNKQDLLIHLFQLCILLNQENMAFNLWNSLEEKLSAAIGAAKMLKSKAKKREKKKYENNSQQSKVSWTKKVLYFYYAPVVTFRLHILSYLAFLFLYAYVILFNFHPPPTNGSMKSVSDPEFVLWAWVFILAIDEVYEIYQRENKGIAKLPAWIKNFWNKLDAVAIVLFIFGIGLR